MLASKRSTRYAAVTCEPRQRAACSGLDCRILQAKQLQAAVSCRLMCVRQPIAAIVPYEGEPAVVAYEEAYHLPRMQCRSYMEWLRRRSSSTARLKFAGLLLVRFASGRRAPECTQHGPCHGECVAALSGDDSLHTGTDYAAVIRRRRPITPRTARPAARSAVVPGSGTEVMGPCWDDVPAVTSTSAKCNTSVPVSWIFT